MMITYKTQVERIANEVASNLNANVLNLEHIDNQFFSSYFRLELSNDLIIVVGEMDVEYGINNEKFIIDYDFEFSGLIDERGINDIINEITAKVGGMA